MSFTHSGRLQIIPPLMQVQTFAPKTAAAAAVPWYLAGGAPAPVAAYQAKGAASYEASLVNLANPGTYDLAMIGAAFSWSSVAGWTVNGSSGRYLQTGIVPAAGWSMAVQFTDHVSGFLVGSFLDGTHTRFGFHPNEGGRRYFYGNGFEEAGAAVVAGNMILAGARGYYNGAQDTPGNQIWSGTGAAITIPGLNGYAIAGVCTGVALAIWNTTLTAGQASALPRRWRPCRAD